MYKKGYIAITSLLIIAAATLAISTTVTLVTISEAQAALAFSYGIEARNIAKGCVEEGLLRLRDNASFTNASFTIENNSCTITVSGTNPYTIVSTGTISHNTVYTKKIQITAKRAGNSITVVSWQEIE